MGRLPDVSYSIGDGGELGTGLCFLAVVAISGSGTGTITNDDAQPAISINDVSQLEGNAATTAFNFNVTLSNPSAQTITVNFATADNTATLLNSDYASNSGTLTFAPGTVSQPVTVLVNGDVAVEANETFFVNLSAPANATIADSQGVGTIINDDSTTNIPLFGGKELALLALLLAATALFGMRRM